MTKQNLTDLLFAFPILLLVVGLPASAYWNFDLPIALVIIAPLIVFLLWILSLSEIAKLKDEGKNGEMVVWLFIVLLAPAIGAYIYYIYELRRKWFPYPAGHPALLPLEEEKYAEPGSGGNADKRSPL
ncbi:hypothetical protein [Pelagicoccus mobilis]|uniref:Cardiolipin synthase N-terminal domain-containing protein n=1 Tax=Pelagicoccus mobilis TaxID=415221 RepID=A0A934S2K4_9BACT|nr:hypothetical protein [Pelagicoccus mobilis]MBK1880708.1 hypothetical protein [Pelagicoccus mobilis]